MKLEVTNPNYCATVIRVRNLAPIPKMDRVVNLTCFGFSTMVSKATEVGQLGVLFTAESLLSDEFCHYNNLYRHSNLNNDQTQVGYIEDNRRIRAIKIRGSISSALFMPLSCLEYLGIDTNELKEGDCFNSIDGREICTKYVVTSKGSAGQKGTSSNQVLRKSRIEARLMPEHIDTSHWAKNEHLVDENEDIIVTNKLHGTSVRLANQVCDRELTYWEKWVKWFGLPVVNTEYDYFAGSRRVIKDIQRKDLEHFYATDIYNQCLQEVKHVIPKNWILYGEIVGWVGGSPIQKNYTYQIPQGKFKFYVYRISIVNPDGMSIDLSWDQVKNFCSVNGIEYVQEMWRGKKKDFNAQDFLDKRFNDMGYKDCPPLDNKDIVDEGVVIRIEGTTPRLFKAKSPIFLGHETKILDEGIADLESQESE